MWPPGGGLRAKELFSHLPVIFLPFSPHFGFLKNRLLKIFYYYEPPCKYKVKRTHPKRSTRGRFKKKKKRKKEKKCRIRNRELGVRTDRTIYESNEKIASTRPLEVRATRWSAGRLPANANFLSDKRIRLSTGLTFLHYSPASDCNRK